MRWRLVTVTTTNDDRVALPSKGKFTFAVSLKWVRGHKSCTFLWLQSILKFDTIIRARTCPPRIKASAHGSPSLLFVSWIFGSFNSVTKNNAHRFDCATISVLHSFHSIFSSANFLFATCKVLWIWTAAAAASVDFIYWPCAISNKLISFELTNVEEENIEVSPLLFRSACLQFNLGLLPAKQVSVCSQKRIRCVVSSTPFHSRKWQNNKHDKKLFCDSLQCEMGSLCC